jgi:hypothetical protein
MQANQMPVSDYLSPSTDLPNVYSTSICLTTLVYALLYTIDQTFASCLLSHTAAPLVLLLSVLRHVFSAALLRSA